MRPNGDGLLFIPSVEFQWLSDEDLAALIAYLKSVPPVDRESTPNKVGPIARAPYLKGDLLLVPAEQVNHEQHPAAVPMSVSVEYGRSLANVGGCVGCHGPGLSGGTIPGTPPDWTPATNLTPAGIGHYTEEDFFRALREGKRPGNVPIDTLMPVRATKQMTDDEVPCALALPQDRAAKAVWRTVTGHSHHEVWRARRGAKRCLNERRRATRS